MGTVPGRMSSVLGRHTRGLQASLFPSRRYTHTSLAQPGPSHPSHIRPTPLAPGQLLWLKRIKDDSLLSLFFFFHPSLDFSFLSMPDERPPRHPLHAHTIQARTHRKSMCCTEEREGRVQEGGGSGEGKERRRGRGHATEEKKQPNASHVGLMRTNLQKMGPCFCFLLFF